MSDRKNAKQNKPTTSRTPKRKPAAAPDLGAALGTNVVHDRIVAAVRALPAEINRWRRYALEGVDDADDFDTLTDALALAWFVGTIPRNLDIPPPPAQLGVLLDALVAWWVAANPELGTPVVNNDVVASLVDRGRALFREPRDPSAWGVTL